MSNNTKQQWLEVSPVKEPFFYLFLFYVVVWYTQLAERWAAWTGDLRIEALVSFVLLAVVLTGTSKKTPEEKAGFTPYVTVYFFVLLIQVWNSWDSSRSWFVFTERVLKYSVMGLFIAYFVRTPAKLRLFIFVWLLACFKIVQEGVYGGVTGSLVWENQGIPRLHGSGLYGHPNSLSQLALGTLPFIYFLMPIVRRRWLKIGLLLLLACSIYCIIFTGSRTGYLGFICLLGFVWWRIPSSGRMKMLLVVLLLLPVAIKFAPEEYKGRFMSTFEGQEAEGRSKEGRKKMYGEGWQIFKKHPFGVGVGNYPLANDHYFHFRQEVHCLYLEVLTHLGIHGFVVFMLLLWKAWVVLKKSLKRLDRVGLVGQCSRDDLLFMQAVGNATLVYMLIRLFVDIFSMDLYGICWWFIIGVGASLFFLSKQASGDSGEEDLAPSQVVVP